jgi:hypothetical protein
MRQQRKFKRSDWIAYNLPWVLLVLIAFCAALLARSCT